MTPTALVLPIKSRITSPPNEWYLQFHHTAQYWKYITAAIQFIALHGSVCRDNPLYLVWITAQPTSHYCTVLYSTVNYQSLQRVSYMPQSTLDKYGYLDIVLYSTVLYCTPLYCTVLHCTVLYLTVLCCTVLHCIVVVAVPHHRLAIALPLHAFYCPALHCTALHCTIAALFYPALYYPVSHYTGLYCKVLPCIELFRHYSILHSLCF